MIDGLDRKARSHLARAIPWRPVTRGGRTLIVSCVSCDASIVNETNAMHREGWLESTGRRRVFLCGECATVPA